jgi:hypothetical protein
MGFGGNALGGRVEGGSDAGGDGSGGLPDVAHIGSISIGNAAERVPSKFTVFPRFALIDSQTVCARVTYGDCVVSSGCLSTTVLPTYASAGTIHIANGANDTELIVEAEAAGGTIMPVYVAAESELPLHGGDTLTVSASGADVPLFSAALSVPEPLRVTAPSPDAAGVIHAQRSRDVVLTLAPRRAQATLELRAGSVVNKQLTCSIGAVAGELVIPAAALDAIGYPQRVTLRTRSVSSIVSGDWRVDMPLTLEVLGSDGAALDSIMIE